MDNGYKDIVKQGLWHNNPALVQVLGLCPLLAVTSTATNSLGLGAATALVMAATNTCISMIRNVVRPELRIPIFVLVIACLVTAVELAMRALLHDLYLVLGIFIPLIVTNCNVIARAEAFASKNSVPRAALDGAAMGAGFAAVVLVLGILREALGKGTVFADAHLMFGEGARWMEITLVHDYHGFLLAMLPPGAFIGLGLLIAGKNIIDRRHAAQARHAEASPTDTLPASV